ncbi:MAG: hypothetical protein IT328_20035 [Caldilineaceae bacterium]|nr:hypothetical protein [Caldilineaceae bacterium]
MTELSITVARRELTSSDWVASWPCPSCERETVEIFTDRPTPAQLKEIRADPLCWRCRQKRQEEAGQMLLIQEGSAQ